MDFNSITFLLLFPIVSIVYYLIPFGMQRYWLLLIDVLFYLFADCTYLPLLTGIIVISYLGAIIIEKRRSASKIILATCIVLNLGILICFKYASFFCKSILSIIPFNEPSVPNFMSQLVMPLGVSFFTFQVIGYLIDVYRSRISAERNLIDYSIFVSFFPKLISGPIVKAESFLPQIKGEKCFDTELVKEGLITLAYGVFLKMVVADNIAYAIESAFSGIDTYSGMNLFVSMLLYSIQIYCDFNGYSQMAIGVSKILGYRLCENFQTPYLAQSVTEFWRRWHISLTSWFREYLYIPLGGNRKGKVRKDVNIMIVFLLSGLWHGASWHFVIWGGINGILLIVEDVLFPQVQKLFCWIGIDKNRLGYKAIRVTLTYIVISVTWLFFRFGCHDAIFIIKKIIFNFSVEWILNCRFVNMFGESRNLAIILISLVVLLLFGICQKKSISIRRILFEQQLLVRWTAYLVILGVIICCGAYGEGYEQTEFIYFQF